MADRDPSKYEEAEPEPGFWSRISWTDVITWYLLAGGAYLMIAVVVSAVRKGFGAFGLGDVLLAVGGTITLIAGELMRRELDIGRWVAIGILVPQALVFTSPLSAFKYQLLGGFYLSYLQGEDDRSVNFSFSFGDPDIFFGSGFPIAFSINLLVAYFLFELAGSVRQGRK